MKKTYSFTLLLILIFTSCSGSDSPDVIKTKSGLYGSRHGQFLINFPNRPHSSVMTTTIGNLEMKMYSLVYNQGVEHRYRVEYIDFPKEILDSWDIEQLFDQTVKTVVTNMESFSIREREIESNEFEKSIKYNIRSSVYDTANGIIRILKSDKRIYVISFLATRNVPNNEDFDAFVESFTIYKPKNPQ